MNSQIYTPHNPIEYSSCGLEKMTISVFDKVIFSDLRDEFMPFNFMLHHDEFKWKPEHNRYKNTFIFWRNIRKYCSVPKIFRKQNAESQP